MRQVPDWQANECNDGDYWNEKLVAPKFPILKNHLITFFIPDKVSLRKEIADVHKDLVQ